MRMQQLVLSIVTLAFSANIAFAQGGTEFTYQGRLLDAGVPANGTFNVDLRLWDDPVAGNQIDVTNTFPSLPILEGLFTVELDFGGNAFDNNDRWLEITVEGVPLVPRQKISRSPYAIQTRGIFVDDVGNVGIGTSGPGSPLDVRTDENLAGYATTTSDTGIGLWGHASDLSGITVGVRGESMSPLGTGVYGVVGNNFGPSYGVYGRSYGDSGTGVFGYASSDTGEATGVYGTSKATSGVGVYGRASAVTGTTFGMFGQSDSTSGRGVYGLAQADTGTTYGIYGKSDSTSGRGVYGWASAITGPTYGGLFQSASTSGIGVYGVASASTGINYGGNFQSTSTTGYGVFGLASASTGENYGGRFESLSTSGYAGYFIGKGNDALYVLNRGSGRGILVDAPSDTAIWARTTTGFAGVHGDNASASGRGVYGRASDTSGVNYGVYGKSDSASGFDFYAGGAGTNYGASSSRRWKHNVTPIGDPLHKLAQLRGVYYDWDQEHGGAHDVGMIAEEVGEVLPEIVQYEENGIDAIGMDYSKMTPLLVEAVKALRVEKDRQIKSLRAEKDSEITLLHTENRELRASLEELQQRLATLESLVLQLQGAK